MGTGRQKGYGAATENGRGPSRRRAAGWAELGWDMTAKEPKRRGWKLLPHGGLITEWTHQSCSIAG